MELGLYTLSDLSSDPNTGVRMSAELSALTSIHIKSVQP
jgi:hypothetical protein